jgi:hypothetical protein
MVSKVPNGSTLTDELIEMINNQKVQEWQEEFLTQRPFSYIIPWEYLIQHQM